MSIPKIIHYCWFGPNPIPEMEKKCIQSWKRHLPDYEIIFWNEATFDVKSVDYVKQAYFCGKYAFVSDYVRINALYSFGGIYLDTDVEVLRNLDEFLENEAFIGFENRTMVGTGIIGAEKNNAILGAMLDYYHANPFINEKGYMDMTTNVKILYKLLVLNGFESEDREQRLKGIHIYKREYFCPKRIGKNEFKVTEHSAVIHHFSGSWLTEKEKKRGNSLLWRNVFRPLLRKTREILLKTLDEDTVKNLEAELRNKMR
ncbi:glycosyltransferase [[Clostridium] symbiosum]|uniref:glycosyltransferase family 32 protein n=1 Tax=Clostridium symbiosum TaxID=1512 RepID=UPI001D070C1B|nr:glycosyltransferase [[Clostridium] symbiosum]MCB6607755.1 glycosyl transferase [[Clostridium] symbiosum]MCB6932616.1 glycosyl transferase [[Clostridium] symbiosum]